MVKKRTQKQDLEVKIEKVKLPPFIEGVKWVPSLISQAVRVFLFNQTKNQRAAKTRAEVKASTRKIYAQKGTGRARHGSVKAPIFVGGGKAHGPKGWLKRLRLPKKMKLKVLAMVLNHLYKQEQIKVINRWPEVRKTKELQQLVEELVPQGKEPGLLLYQQGKADYIWRTGRNLPYLMIKTVEEVSFYDLLKAKQVVIDKESWQKLVYRGRKKDES